MAGKSRKSKDVHSALPVLEMHRKGKGQLVDLVVSTPRGGGSMAYRVVVTDIQSVDPGGFVAIVESRGAPRLVPRLAEETQTSVKRKRL